MALTMNMLTEQDAIDLRVLVSALTREAVGGVAATTLASQTGLPVSRVGFLLRRHSVYFVGLRGGQRYTINRFGRHRGVEERIFAHISSARARSRLIAGAGFWSGLAVALLCLLAPLAVFVGTGQNPGLPWLAVAALLCLLCASGSIAARRFA